MKKKKPSTKPNVDESLETLGDTKVLFSIVQLTVDQGPPIPTQRIVQVVYRDGVEKMYVTESAYFRSELMEILAELITNSYDESIMKRHRFLRPATAQKYWVHFTPEIVEGGRGERVNPENFE